MKLCAALMIAGSCLALAACNKTTIAWSPDAHKLVPVVRPGETIEWTGIIPDFHGDSPCERDGESKCVIKAHPAGKVYFYGCAHFDCDPEIAVDDPGGVILKGGTAPGMVADETVVHLTCDVAGNVKADVTAVDAKGTLAWGAFDGNVQDGWKVTIGSPDLCNEGQNFDREHTCGVKAPSGTSFNYTVEGICKTQPQPNSTLPISVK